MPKKHFSQSNSAASKTASPYSKAGRNLRAETAKSIFSVLEQGRSLRECLPAHQVAFSEQDKAWMQEMVFGVMRKLPLLQFWLRKLLDKPLKGKTKIVESLLLLGFYQIAFSRVPSHAAVSESVDASVKLGNASLKGLVNGVLRNFIRAEWVNEKPSDPFIEAGLPKWLYKKLANAYGDQLDSVVAGMQQKPPLWLRINTTQISVTDYQAALEKAGYSDFHLATPPHQEAIIFNKSTNVTQLPGYQEGWFSVQDGAAQLAAYYLSPQPGDRILDACCAPGGKTSHLLEKQPSLRECVAIDSDATRLDRVSENLSRLQLQANLLCADLQALDQWWDGQCFDRILLDAPCSASGVIRRHPDIMWLRKSTDIESLVATQQTIMQSLWRTLKPGGTFLYATCSILEQENQAQIRQFISAHNDCQLLPISNNESDTQPGRQILPGEQGMDGFYYARLIKTEQ